MGTDRSPHGRQCAMLNVDVAVIGGGIAGAELAAMAAPHARIAILEMEERPGYHTTGRSAAFYAETFGGAAVQPLTNASKGVLENPRTGKRHGGEEGDSQCRSRWVAVTSKKTTKN